MGSLRSLVTDTFKIVSLTFPHLSKQKLTRFYEQFLLNATLNFIIFFIKLYFNQTTIPFIYDRLLIQ